MPHPLGLGIGVFARQRIREVDSPTVRGESLRVEVFDVLEMLL